MTAIPPTLWSKDNSVPLTVEDTVLTIRSSRRRHIITLIEEWDEKVSVGELAEAIAAIEADKTIPEVTSEERKNVYISLTQLHLETLEENGAVTYHERSKHVYTGDTTSGLAELIRHFESVCETEAGDE